MLRKPVLLAVPSLLSPRPVLLPPCVLTDKETSVTQMQQAQRCLKDVFIQNEQTLDLRISINSAARVFGGLFSPGGERCDGRNEFSGAAAVWALVSWTSALTSSALRPEVNMCTTYAIIGRTLTRQVEPYETNDALACPYAFPPAAQSDPCLWLSGHIVMTFH